MNKQEVLYTKKGNIIYVGNFYEYLKQSYRDIWEPLSLHIGYLKNTISRRNIQIKYLKQAICKYEDFILAKELSVDFGNPFNR